MARARGANAKLNVGYETVWGTAPASAYYEVPFVSSGIGANQPLEAEALLGQGREPQIPTYGDIEAGGELVVPIDVRNMGFWLKGLLGTPSTTGLGPYTHTFDSGASSIPSIAAEVGNPEIPAYAMNTGLYVGSMAVPFITGTGQPNATLSLVGKDESVSASSGAGTPTVLATQRFSRFQGSIDRESVALANITAADLTYNNNLDTARFLGGSGALAAIDPGDISLSGSLTARFADTMLIDDAVAGSPVALEFAYVIDVNNSLTITVHDVYLPRASRSIQGPGGIEATYNWQASRQSAGGQSMTVVLVNDVASY